MTDVPMAGTFALPKPRTLIGANLFLMALFWILVPSGIPDWFAILVQAARGSMSAIVVCTYGWSIYQFTKDKTPAPSQALIVGIFLAFLADVYGSFLGIAWRWFGRPEYWTAENFWIFGSFITSIAAIHHVAVPGAIDGRVPKRNVVIVGLALTIAGLVAGIVIGMQVRDTMAF